MVNKRLINTGEAVAAFDPLQNFETVTYTGNGGTQKITGYIRKGAAFNGSSSYISVGNPIPNTDTNVTISAWINLSSGVSSSMHITGTGITTAGSEAPFRATLQYQSANTFRIFALRQVAGTYYLSSNSSLTNVTINAGTWYHIVWSYTASGRKLNTFLNGVQIDTDVAMTTTGASVNDDSMIIGSFRTNTAFFNGKLDQVRFFNTALNSTQAGQLADEEYGDAKNSTTDFFGNGSGVALYELDGDANDTGVPIDSGQSAVFNGSSSKIDLPVLGLSGGAARSVSAWIKTTNNSTMQFIFGSGTQASYQVFSVHLSPTGKVSVGYSSSQLDTTSTPINNNQWHHIAVTFSGGSTANTVLYVDGVSQTLTEIGSAGTVNTGNQNYAIGYNSPNPSFPFYFNGQIDDLRVYSDVLTLTEVGYIYNNTTASIPTDYLAYYKLNGNDNDETGNYNGTTETSITYSDAALIAYNGTPTNVNFLGMAFQPDFVWIKGRVQNQHSGIFDSVRGADLWLRSGTTDAENDFGGGYGVTSFDSNGFTIGSGSAINANGDGNVAWCWKAGGSVTPNNNTNGTITSTVSANQDAGFSIVTWTGDGNDATVGHGLSSQPELVITKGRANLAAYNQWVTYHKDLQDDYVVFLNLNDAEADGQGNYWRKSAFSNTVFGLGNDIYGPNVSGTTMVGYCFHSVDGYQKVGSFDGTGTATGNIVTTGFRPRFLMWKSTIGTGNWQIVDSTRSPLADKRNQLYADLSQGEDVTSYDIVDFNDDSFQMKQQYTNKLNETYIYLAIA